MPTRSHLLQHLHIAVYEQTGWALPDDGLRTLAHHVPASLLGHADQPEARARVRAWCLSERATVMAAIHTLRQMSFELAA